MSLTTSIISAYTFENSGSMGTDDSGNGNNLTKTGTVNQVAGNADPGSYSAEWTDSGGFSPLGVLAGACNRITVATDFAAIVQVYVQNGSWNTTPYDMFVCGCFSAGSDQWGIFLDQSTQEFYFTVSAGGAGGPKVHDGQGAISFNTWYTIYVDWAWNIVNSTMRISRDDTSIVSSLAGFADPYNTTPAQFSIGSNGHGAGFTMDGRTDGVACWNRVLTSAEQTQLHNSGNGLEWPFPSTASRRRCFITFI